MESKTVKILRVERPANKYEALIRLHKLSKSITSYSRKARPLPLWVAIEAIITYTSRKSVKSSLITA
jgi:hypothetical protein